MARNRTVELEDSAGGGPETFRYRYNCPGLWPNVSMARPRNRLRRIWTYRIVSPRATSSKRPCASDVVGHPASCAMPPPSQYGKHYLHSKSAGFLRSWWALNGPLTGLAQSKHPLGPVDQGQGEAVHVRGIWTHHGLVHQQGLRMVKDLMEKSSSTV